MKIAKIYEQSPQGDHGTNPIADAAIQLIRAGFSVIPINADHKIGGRIFNKKAIWTDFLMPAVSTRRRIDGNCFIGGLLFDLLTGFLFISGRADEWIV